MTEVNVHEAKTHLSRLLERAERGEEIVICKAGKPMAKLVPLVQKGGIRLGTLKGMWTVPDDFDDPLPPEVLATFYAVDDLFS